MFPRAASFLRRIGSNLPTLRLVFRMLALVTCWLAVSGTAAAYSSGITTNRFPTLSLGCNSSGCHSGGSTPTVTLRRADGGTGSVLPGTSVQLEAIIQMTGGNCFAGFNVSTTGGTAGPRLDAVESGTVRHDAVNEVSHNTKRAASDWNGVSNTTCSAPIKFLVNATMPSTTGNVTFTLWGNSVNNSTTPAGDRANTTTLELTVAKRGYGESCSSGSQCTGGNCVDGVCCQSASCPAGNGQCIGNAKCQAGTGTCSTRPNLSADTVCDDGNAETVQDHCDGAGSCSGTLRSGTVWSWGDNGFGQLGRSATGGVASTPGLLGSGPKNIVQVSTGDNHVAALTSDGRVWTWGYNGSGQLGDPAVTSTYRQAPAQAATGSRFMTAIAAGGYHTLALNYDGTVWAWGSNSRGQLGDPSFTGGSSSSPRQVQGLRDVVAIAAGGSHSLAITADGKVWAWGENSDGQIGDGTQTIRRSPTRPQIGIYMKKIAAGQASSYALGTNGTVYVWGSNWQEALGLGASGSGVLRQLKPITNSVTTARDIVAGNSHALAVLSDGTVKSWGYNAFGNLGLGHTTSPVAYPTTVPSLSGVVGLAAGGSHSAFLRDDGTVWVSGSNYAGQLGGAATSDISVPTRVPNLSGIQSIESSYGALYAVEPLQGVLSWGNDTYAALGLGSAHLGAPVATVQVVAAPVGTDSQGRRRLFKDMSAGCYHGLALATNGTVWAWGNDDLGQAGQGTTGGNRPYPTQVPGLDGVIDVEAGCYHSAALRSDGTVWTWGYNAYGTLGVGDTVNRSSPVQVSTPRVTQISGTFLHMLVLAHTGNVHGWGYNADRQVNGTTGNVLSPVRIQMEVSGLRARYVASGTTSSYFVHDFGEVASWGGNAVGQLGTGSTGTGRSAPARIANLTNVTKVSAGANFALVLTSSSALWGFGSNSYGQFGGAGGSTHYASPALLAGAYITDIDAGYFNSAAEIADGRWMTAGYGGYGVLANGSFDNAGWTVIQRLQSAVQVDLGGYHGFALVP